VAAGSDITGDDVREVYAGTVSGHVVCIDGAVGTLVWDAVADPMAAENVLSLTNIPDVTGDDIDDIVCGTLGDYIVVLDGWSGETYFATNGIGPFEAIDVVGVLPDIDNNGSWEILAGNRSGLMQVLAGGTGFVGPSGWVTGIVRSFGPNLPIQGVEISADGVTNSVFSGPNGTFSLPLPAGIYTVRMQRAGYCDLVYEDVEVEEDTSTPINALMQSINATFSVSSLNVLVQRPNSSAQEFVISNPTAGCALSFSIVDTSVWLSVEPASGVLESNETQIISVTLESADLEGGSYQSTILVEHNDENSPYSIAVFMDVIDDVSDNDLLLPTEFKLYSAYPNPFNPSTTISYDIAAETEIRLSVFNSLGQHIRTLAQGTAIRGHHVVTWDGRSDMGISTASGLYFVRLESPLYTATQKIMMIK
jgi:hypothetical protein